MSRVIVWVAGWLALVTVSPSFAGPSATGPDRGGTGETELARREYLRARGLMAEGSYGEAITHFDAALELFPTWSLPKLGLAVCHRYLGHPPSTRQGLLEEARAVDPRNHKILHELGILYEELGDEDRAIEAYRAAVAIRPDLPHAHERLGILLYDQDKLDEAGGELATSEAQAPGNVVALTLLAEILERQHRYAEAEARLRELIARYQDNPRFHERLARFLERRGRVKEARVERARAERLLEAKGLRPVRGRRRQLPRSPR